MKAPHPPRQMTLVGKAGAGGDFSQARSSLASKLDRMLQSQMHDVTVRRHANRSGEHASEVERAAPCYLRERGHLDRPIQVGNDIVFKSLKHLPAQRAPRPGRGP
jgi:hypothetical protein